jgi:hypothetical protein
VQAAQIKVAADDLVVIHHNVFSRHALAAASSA